MQDADAFYDDLRAHGIEHNDALSAGVQVTGQAGEGAIAVAVQPQAVLVEALRGDQLRQPPAQLRSGPDEPARTPLERSQGPTWMTVGMLIVCHRIRPAQVKVHRRPTYLSRDTQRPRSHQCLRLGLGFCRRSAATS